MIHFAYVIVGAAVAALVSAILIIGQYRFKNALDDTPLELDCRQREIVKAVVVCATICAGCVNGVTTYHLSGLGRLLGLMSTPLLVLLSFLVLQSAYLALFGTKNYRGLVKMTMQFVDFGAGLVAKCLSSTREV